MPNFLENLRLRNLFDPQTSGGPFSQPFQNIQFGPTDLPQNSVSTQNPQGYYDPNFDVTQRMQELYNPQTTASDRFNELLGQQPRREEYKPSFLRRIGSALTAFGPGGYEGGMELLYRPFSEQQESWKNAIGPAQHAAELERSQNINERQLAYQTVSQELRQRVDESRARGQEEQNRIRADRAEIYRLKSLVPNYKFDTRGPTVKLMDPTTGQVSDTGIETGSLSESDKLALQQEQALERISTGGKEARQTESTRQAGRESLAETRGWTIANIPDPNDPSGQRQIGVKINQITGETIPIQMGGKGVGPVARPSGVTGRTGETPSQTRVRQLNSARQFKESNPGLGKYITISGNDFQVRAPGRFGPTPEEHQKIIDAIFGGELPVTQPTRTGASVQQQQQVIKQYSPSRNQTRISMDGGQTWKILEGRQ